MSQFLRTSFRVLLIFGGHSSKIFYIVTAVAARILAKFFDNDSWLLIYD